MHVSFQKLAVAMACVVLGGLVLKVVFDPQLREDSHLGGIPLVASDAERAAGASPASPRPVRSFSGAIKPAVDLSDASPGNLSIDQIRAALDATYRQPDNYERAARIRALVERWAALNPHSAFQFLETMPDDETKQLCVVAISRVISGAIPQKIAERLPGMPNGAVKSEWMQALAQCWPASDVPAALRWANELPEGDEKQNALNQIESSWITQNTGEAAAYAEQLPPGPARSEWIKNLAAQWSRTDFDAALAWVNRLDDSGRTIAVASIAKTCAMEEPVEAAKFVAQLPPGELQTDAAIVVSGTWALQDPAGAAGWALQFSDPHLRDEALRQVVGSWATKDLAGLFNWARLLPAGPARDSVIANVVEQTASLLPDGTNGLIGLISDKAKQTELAANARTWSQTAPTPGARW